jgi:hypothetical protein
VVEPRGEAKFLLGGDEQHPCPHGLERPRAELVLATSTTRRYGPASNDTIANDVLLGGEIVRRLVRDAQPRSRRPSSLTQPPGRGREIVLVLSHVG